MTRPYPPAFDPREMAQRVAARHLIAVRKLWWHGTSPKNIRSILKQGLLPSGTDLVFTDEGGKGDQSRSIKTFGGVYLTDNWGTAESAGVQASPDKKRYAMVGVTFETRSPKTIADEDDVIPDVGRALQAERADDLFYGPTFWARGDLGARFSRLEGIPYNYSQWPEIIEAIQSADLREPIERLMVALTYKRPTAWARYERQKQEIDALAADLMRAYTFHLLEVNYLAKRDEEREKLEKYLAPDRKWYMDDPEYIEEEKDRVRASLRQLNNPPPEIRNTFQAMKEATDRFSSKMQVLATPPKDYQKFRNNLRVLVPIGYRGKNRILLVVEVLERESKEHKFGRYYSDIIVYYNAGGGALDAFREGMERVWGGSYRILNRNGRVLDTHLKDRAEWPEDLWGPKHEAA